MSVDDGEWEKESHWRLGVVSSWFKPAEVLTIVEFITTARTLREEQEAQEDE